MEPPFSDDDDVESDDQKQLKSFKKTFINAKIINEELDKAVDQYLG